MTKGLAGLVLAAGLCGQGWAQSGRPAVCSLEKGVYTCNWKTFRPKLDAAQTVSLQTQQQPDVRAVDAMTKLATQLGKTVVPLSETPADLTFLLIPLNNTGSFFGGNDQDLATLRIYTGRTASQPGTLVWAEAYRGQDDMPWPAVVHYLLDQFQDRLKKK